MAFSFAGMWRGVLAAFGWRGDSRLYPAGMPGNFAGLKLTRDEALALSAVWACIMVIGENIAAAPLNVYEPVEGTKRRRRIERDNRVWLLNTRPNDEMTAMGFREALLFQALADGNSYAEIQRDRGGRVAALVPLLNNRVTPRRTDTGELVYDVSHESGETVTLEQREVLHLRGPSLSGLMGESVIVRAARALAVAAAHERFSASFYGRGAQLGGVLKAQSKLTDEQKKTLREAWEENHAGLGKSQRLLVLEGGFDFVATTVEPAKASLVEDKKFSIEEIARFYRVPLHKIGHLEHATFSNIEHQGLEFVTSCLFPWCQRLCQELNAKVFNTGSKGPWWYAEIDLSHLVRGDSQSRALAAASWLQNGVKSRNEVRAEEGLDDVGDDGDVLTVQANMTTLERITTAAPGTATQAQQAVASALRSACARYSRRLEARLVVLKGKSDIERHAVLARFRTEQLQVLVDDMAFFGAQCVEAIGGPFTRELAVQVIEAHEHGEDLARVVSALPPRRLGAAA